MNKKRQKFFEEFSENFADLFVETFAVRYGSIDDYDIFIEDFKKCMTLTCIIIKGVSYERTKY